MAELSFPERIERRARALSFVRRFFEERGFFEVDAPQLVPAPTTEPHIDPIAALVKARDDSPPEPRWLHTSPELALKRVLAAGVPRVFCLEHAFRDGERTARHLPELMLLEWYRARAPLAALVDDAAELLRESARALTGTTTVSGVDLAQRPEVRTVEELFREHAGVELGAALARMADGDERALVDAVARAGHKLRAGADFEDAFFHVMLARVEPVIGRARAMVVTRWPRQLAVLARGCDDDALFAERFEVYAGGLELANAFDELTDPVEQRARFGADNDARARMGKPRLPLDELFLAQLARMPPSSGIALGFDRLLMLLFGASDIVDVVPLPFR